jgi:heme exporter protein D
MSEFFKNGGYGMFPTLVVGLFLLATAVLYAVRPSGRRARVALVLGTVHARLGAPRRLGGHGDDGPFHPPRSRRATSSRFSP